MAKSRSSQARRIAHASELMGYTPSGPVSFDAAQAIALKNRRPILVLTGMLDGANGLPAAQDHYGSGIRLRMMKSYSHRLTTGVFEVMDVDALCDLVDELQESGGYKGYVVSENGDMDPSYRL